jgi:phosphoribosylamine-glycine ligase
MVSRECLGTMLDRRASLREACWIWDGNHSVEANETLRAEGFRVVGGGRHADRMEHDRAACLDFVARCGLSVPASHSFDDPGPALELCQRTPETAYVFKPDSGEKFETFVPESPDPALANEEVQEHLRARTSPGRFLLQERKDGVENNVEVWFQRGEPRFAFLTLECKKKHALDLGPLSGCALDFAFVIPLDCRAVTESVGKLFPVYREMGFSGFCDANVITGKDGVWFLEKCERLGYNAHPNLLFNLARRPLAEVFSSLADGTFEPDFAEGFGASLTMWTKEFVTAGEAIFFPPKAASSLYFWDAYVEHGRHRIAGFDPEGAVLVVLDHGYTIPTAWEAVLKTAAAVRFPYRYYRPDGEQTNYPSSPVRRYEALKAMGYV